VSAAGARRSPVLRPSRLGRLSSHVVLIAGALVILMPFAWMITTSLKSPGEVHLPPYLWPSSFDASNYSKALETGNFGRYYLNSTIVTGAVVAAQVMLSSMAGYAFARLKFPGKGLLFGLVMATMMVPIYVTLVPRYLTIRSLGWLDSYPGLIVPQIVTPFGIFLTRQYYLSMSKSYEEAALIDGAGRIRVWWSIAMPMSAPVMAVLGIFGFLFAWNDFLWPLVVVTDENMRTVQLGLAMFSGRYGTQWTLLAAGSLVATLPALLAFLAGQRWLIRGITLGDVK
jgi:multiple sugar transport system permease protein